MDEINETPAAESTNAGTDGGQPTPSSTPDPAASSVSSPTNDGQSPVNSTDQSGQAGQDWQKRYLETQDLYAKQLKSFNELRGKLVTQGTEKNKFADELKGMKTQMQQIAEALAKATATPYDPDQFMEELRTQGPKAIENHLKGTIDKQAQAYEAKIQAISGQMRKMNTSFAVKECRADSKNYPDFQKMEGTMAEVMTELRENFKAGLIGDPDQVEPEELVGYLYNEAKLRHSQDAIKAAEAHGAAKATAELAKEASTAVAGGGRSAKLVPTDPNKMTSDQLAELIKAQGRYEVE